MTQQEFADMIRLSVRAYGNYERGERELARRHQLEIIRQTGEDPFDLQRQCYRPCVSEKYRKKRAGRISGLNVRIRSVRLWRENLITQMERHCTAVYSKRTRLRIKIEDNLLAAATIYAWLHLQMLHFELPVVLPVGEGSWGLPLLFGIVVVLLPRQIIRFIRFYKWRNSSV